MIDNILKEKDYRINLSRNIVLNKIVNIQKIHDHNYENSPLKINGFNISKKGNYFILEKGRFFDDEKTITLFKMLNGYDEIKLKYERIFTQLNLNNKIIIKNKKQLVLFIYFELIILLELAAIKQFLSVDNENEKEKIKMILGSKVKFSEIKKKGKSKHYVRAGLAQRSNNAHYWNRCIYSKNISYELLKISKEINANEIEFPSQYDEEKLYLLLKDFNEKLIQLKIDTRDFEIRFKRIAHYKKTGMYIKNAQCFIVDPRFATSLYHELGHFLFETKTKFYLNEMEIDGDEMHNIVNKQKDNYIDYIKNHKAEELNENSEIFAYWFEDEIKKLFINKKN